MRARLSVQLVDRGKGAKRGDFGSAGGFAIALIKNILFLLLLLLLLLLLDSIHLSIFCGYGV